MCSHVLMITSCKICTNSVGSQVDKHIRRLDADLARFENELKEKMEVSGYESPDGRALKSKNCTDTCPACVKRWLKN